MPPVPQHTHVRQQQQYLVKKHSQRPHLAPHTLPLHLPCLPCLSSYKSLPNPPFLWEAIVEHCHAPPAPRAGNHLPSRFVRAPPQGAQDWAPRRHFEPAWQTPRRSQRDAAPGTAPAAAPPAP